MDNVINTFISYALCLSPDRNVMVSNSIYSYTAGVFHYPAAHKLPIIHVTAHVLKCYMDGIIPCTYHVIMTL